MSMPQVRGKKTNTNKWKTNVQIRCVCVHVCVTALILPLSLSLSILYLVLGHSRGLIKNTRAGSGGSVLFWARKHNIKHMCAISAFVHHKHTFSSRHAFLFSLYYLLTTIYYFPILSLFYLSLFTIKLLCQQNGVWSCCATIIFANGYCNMGPSDAEGCTVFLLSDVSTPIDHRNVHWVFGWMKTFFHYIFVRTIQVNLYYTARYFTNLLILTNIIISQYGT